MCDEEIAELLQECPHIMDLALVDMQFGTTTIESIASTFPNISNIELSGSSVVTDVAIRCLTSVCVHIQELGIKYCPKLTDDAFSRCIMLKQVIKLDLTHCSYNLTGAFLS